MIDAGRIVLSDEESESQWQRNDYKGVKMNFFNPINFRENTTKIVYFIA